MSSAALNIEPHLPRLRRYARSLVRNSTRADDLVQDTVVRALEKAHLFQAGTNLRGWLFTLMHNEHVNTARRFLRGPVFVPDDEARHMGCAATQEAPVALNEIRRAVDRLPAIHREPLLLHWVDGLTYDEIARRLGLPMGTVQSRISRARKALHEMVGA